MSNLVKPVEESGEEREDLYGGKATSLGKLVRGGLNIPPAVVVSSKAYDNFLAETGLGGRIKVELNRKSFDDMRWEEIWDTSLRIRNMFITTELPDDLFGELKDSIKDFQDKPVVVRSSATEEDRMDVSFAGLHESFVNVRGIESIIEKIKLVWSSLWSDGALMYRKKMSIGLEKSSMAVVVQEFIEGEKSGVIFGKGPEDGNDRILESVYGLNEGLVDGEVDPDRWIIDENTDKIIEHIPISREVAIFSGSDGTEKRDLPEDKREVPPLDDFEVDKVVSVSKKADSLFGTPQDLEWTIKEGKIYVLQSRPISTIDRGNQDGELSYYQSLKPKFEKMKVLRKKVEDNLLPSLVEEIENLDKMNLEDFSNSELAEEVGRRRDIYNKWHDIYYDEFIPLAHGVRLFGQFYNDVMKPQDPYEFVNLLRGADFISKKRNDKLLELTEMIRDSGDLKKQLKNGKKKTDNPDFEKNFAEIIDMYDESLFSSYETRDSLIELLLEFVKNPTGKNRKYRSIEQIEDEFIEEFDEDKRDFAKEILELGRASYRLRDNDNIYMGKLENRVTYAIEEGKDRIRESGRTVSTDVSEVEVISALKDSSYTPKKPDKEKKSDESHQKIKQLRGQPASGGVSTGKVRVIKEKSDLFDFKEGEILVVDSINPTMTFVVPIASGIVERRGGMLVHGAIIAREYGIPCVTGIANAADILKNGDGVTVDGYLGIVKVVEAN